MKKLLYFLTGLILAICSIGFFGIQYLNSGSLQPDNSVWNSYIGRDTTVGILPDQYANYFAYTLARTNEDIGFKISGKFPDTRYFSFNVYSLDDNATQGSLVDYKIQTDSGKPNPFLVNKDSVDAGERFTVHLIPKKFEEKKLPNQLTFRDDARLMTMVIRLYDYNIDDFGGVEFPTVEAFTIEEDIEEVQLNPVNLPMALDLRSIVSRYSLPKMVERLALVFETENTKKLDDAEEAHFTIPFHAIDDSGFIENNDNRYLLAALTKEEDEVFIFKFKAPTYTTGAENINQTETRYWSFNLGNAASYNFNGLKDEEAKLDSAGFVTVVLASEDAEIREQTDKLGYNFMEWNMLWKKGFILFRHMLANPDFVAQIDDVPPITSNTKDFESTEARLFIGDYAPRGIRMSKEDFLKEYQKIEVQ